MPLVNMYRRKIKDERIKNIWRKKEQRNEGEEKNRRELEARERISFSANCKSRRRKKEEKKKKKKKRHFIPGARNYFNANITTAALLKIIQHRRWNYLRAIHADAWFLRSLLFASFRIIPFATNPRRSLLFRVDWPFSHPDSLIVAAWSIFSADVYPQRRSQPERLHRTTSLFPSDFSCPVFLNVAPPSCALRKTKGKKEVRIDNETEFYLDDERVRSFSDDGTDGACSSNRAIDRRMDRGSFRSGKIKLTFDTSVIWLIRSVSYENRVERKIKKINFKYF